MFLKKRKKVSHRKEPQLVTESAPFEYIESYKALRTNFNFVTANGTYRKILVTSALRDEGKSSISINLAISLAQAGNKVLLIDADMRNPSIHRYLKMKKDANIGLSTLLTSDVKVGDCLVNTEYGIDVIPGGPIPPNPAELIASEGMRDLLNVAAKHYDYIICDTPPVGIITDAAACSPLCDGVLYVIRHNYATKNQIDSAIKSLQSVNAKMLGIIMSQYAIPKNPRKGYGHYKYSYQYGYGYGYGYGYAPQYTEETE